jgi:hypothetical protein
LLREIAFFDIKPASQYLFSNFGSTRHLMPGCERSKLTGSKAGIGDRRRMQVDTALSEET